MSKKSINNLKVDEQLIKFVNEEAIPGTNINIDNFWNGFDKAVHELAPINKKLINKRDEIQKKIDEWHLSNKGTTFDKSKYYNFLKSINYIVEEKADFKITTSNVDNEIATIAGPQLVVPVDNSRYALNAANARWGSLYDALYGTDVIPGEKGKGYNAERGNKVRNYVRKFLDDVVPLSELKWHEITKIQIEDDKLVFFSKDKKYYLKNNNQFIGFNGEKNRPNSILIKNNNLHI
jgi:malate synthase